MSYFFRRYARPGTSPGTLAEHETEEISQPPTIEAIVYWPGALDREQLTDWSQLRRPGADKRLWLDISGQPDPALLERLGAVFDLHPLALEDVLNSGQRTKLDNYETHLFMVINLPGWDGRQLRLRQVSLFLGENFVISFCGDRPGLFNPVRRRLETSPNGRIRSNETDYLFYALLDLAIDEGFPILEAYSEELQEIESVLVHRPGTDLLERIHENRRELVFLKRALWSQRDAVHLLLRDDIPLVRHGTRMYLRDCEDHAIQLLDLVESYRDMSQALLELQMTTISNRLNDVMRVLTVIATVFMPLSFLAALYGMNFNTHSPWNMPELDWRFGYPVTLGVMLLIAVAMLAFFRRKRWL
ncbi:MAG: magnesium/cobalt transporter CorA [Gammaproteobacteria bacterium]|jgi:magnesium transporter